MDKIKTTMTMVRPDGSEHPLVLFYRQTENGPEFDEMVSATKLTPQEQQGAIAHGMTLARKLMAHQA
jgi:hypothetical protein